METGETLRGRGLSPGVAVGPAVSLRRDLGAVYRLQVDSARVEDEVVRLQNAVARMDGELAKTRESVEREVGSDLAAIFDAHHLILHDPLFLGQIENLIRTRRVNAEWAIQEVGSELGEQFARIETAHLRERGQDVEDVVRYLLASFPEIERTASETWGSEAILVADELTPSEALRLGRGGTRGFVLEGGGESSHTVIVARALCIPLVLGVEDARNRVKDGATLLIDGTEGTVVLQPSSEQCRRALEHAREVDQVEDLPSTASAQVAHTACGAPVDLLSNIEILDEIDASLGAQAQGIGLYRSEFLYIETSPELPSEEEHLQAYSRLLSSHAPRPVTIRTFDLGGRELAGGLLQRREANPGLGLRGVRLTLTQRQIFTTQLRALLRVAGAGNLRILVPMISSVDEMELFRSLLAEVRAQLLAEGHDVPPVPIGAMIEVPGAALVARHLASRVDFFAIGTNDLTQYTLAVDRNNDQVAGLYRPLHPAVLALIEGVIVAAREHATEVSVCGEMAGDARLTELLLGAGVRHFSMSPRRISEVRRRIGECRLEAAEALWQRARACSTAEEVRRCLL